MEVTTFTSELHDCNCTSIELLLHHCTCMQTAFITSKQLFRAEPQVTHQRKVPVHVCPLHNSVIVLRKLHALGGGGVGVGGQSLGACIAGARTIHTEHTSTILERTTNE